jgi:hypothetical protein
LRTLVTSAAVLSLLAACAATGDFGAGGGVSSLGGGNFGRSVRKRTVSPADFMPAPFAALAANGREMRNRPVRVRALIEPDPPARATLRDPAGATPARIAADVRGLEPEEQAWIAANCAGAAPCEAELLGYVQAPLGTDEFYLDAYFLAGRPG